MKALPPRWYDMFVTINMKIKKGQKSGFINIPCSFEVLTHQIDLNPSLIRRKDNKEMGYFNPREKWRFIEDEKIRTYKKIPLENKIVYNPKKYDVIITDEEKKKKWELFEIDRCDHCGQKTWIAKVEETHYKSCPIIKVGLSDPAKEDLIVPVKFGVARAQFYKGFINYIFFVGIVVGGLLLSNYYNKSVWFSIGLVAICFSSLFFHSIRTARLFKWYVKYRPNAEIKKEQPLWMNILQQCGIA